MELCWVWFLMHEIRVEIKKFSTYSILLIGKQETLILTLCSGPFFLYTSNSLGTTEDWLKSCNRSGMHVFLDSMLNTTKGVCHLDRSSYLVWLVHPSVKDHIYCSSLVFNEAKYKNLLGEPEHNWSSENDVISDSSIICVCCVLATVY